MKYQSLLQRGLISITQYPCGLSETRQRPATWQGLSNAPVHLWREGPGCRPDEALLEAITLKVYRFAKGVCAAV